MTYRFHAACATLQRDPAELRLRDRAVLRILNRAGAATASQLTVLAYRNRRLAQAHLRRLWADGLLERALLPPAGPRGGAPFAYRLSAACLQRLGYRRNPWRGPGYLTHTLDGVDAACSLVGTSDPEGGSPVQLWLPESIASDVLPDGILPDALVVLATAAGSGVVCLEIDEATQHVAPIRNKLRAYHRVLESRQGWHVLFVVPTVTRQAWLRRVTARLDLGPGRLWTATLRELGQAGMDSVVAGLGSGAQTTTLRTAMDDPEPRWSGTPAGSAGWLELLGSGGGEELSGLLG